MLLYNKENHSLSLWCMLSSIYLTDVSHLLCLHCSYVWQNAIMYD